jgi:hypothetical protein
MSSPKSIKGVEAALLGLCPTDIAHIIAEIYDGIDEVQGSLPEGDPAEHALLQLMEKMHRDLGCE